MRFSIYFLFLIFITSAHADETAVSTQAIVETPANPVPNEAILQPSVPAAEPPETLPAGDAARWLNPEIGLIGEAPVLAEAGPQYRKKPPVCLRRMTAPPPTDQELDFNEMMAPGFKLSKWKFLFGKGDDETTVEKIIEDLIVRLDHALVVGSTNKAKHLIVEKKFGALFKGPVPFVMTVENMWAIVEYAQVRMRAALQRAAFLKHHPNEALLQKEYEVYYAQAWWFGRYFKIYSRLRKHLASILRNPRCSLHCKRRARWLLEDLGTRDRRVLSVRRNEDNAFNNELVAAGIDQKYAQTHFFEEIVMASNVSTLTELKGECVPSTVPSTLAQANQSLVLVNSSKDYWERASKVAAQYGNPIDADDMQELSLDPYIQNIMNTSEGRTQFYCALKGIFSKPPAARASLLFADRFPGGRWMKNSALMKFWFARLRITELNDDYAYDLTRMNRDFTVDMGTLLMEIRHLSAKSTEDDAGINDVLELIARRPDLQDMWLRIVAEVRKPDAENRHADIRGKIEAWEAKRIDGKLTAISPIYRISPWENFVRWGAYVAAAAYTYYNPAAVHQAGNFLVHTFPTFLQGLW
jgi:hypothetical protein